MFVEFKSSGGYYQAFGWYKDRVCLFITSNSRNCTSSALSPMRRFVLPLGIIKPVDPKTRKRVRSGVIENNCFTGDGACERRGRLFQISQEYCAAKVQKFRETLPAAINTLMEALVVWWERYIFPFSRGLYSTLFSWWIPCLVSKIEAFDSRIHCRYQIWSNECDVQWDFVVWWIMLSILQPRHSSVREREPIKNLCSGQLP